MTRDARAIATNFLAATLLLAVLAGDLRAAFFLTVTRYADIVLLGWGFEPRLRHWYNFNTLVRESHVATSSPS